MPKARLEKTRIIRLLKHKDLSPTKLIHTRSARNQYIVRVWDNSVGQRDYRLSDIHPLYKPFDRIKGSPDKIGPDRRQRLGASLKFLVTNSFKVY